MRLRLRQLGASDDDVSDLEIAWSDEGDEARPALLGPEGRNRLYLMNDAELIDELVDWRRQREST